MDTEPKEPKEEERSKHATWLPSDERVLINFLLEHKAEVGDGANFKTSIWNEAAAMFELIPRTGGPKTANSCKNKWAKVCSDTHSIPFIHQNSDSSRKPSMSSKALCHSLVSLGTPRTVLIYHWGNRLHGMTT
jgi:hypothetical protein